MIQYLQNILKPSCYQGQGKKPPFFEGWYFKLVDAEEKHTFAVIPGIFLGENPGNTYSFVQVLDGKNNRLSFHRFSAEDFGARNDVFDIRVGQNHFSTHRIRLNIKDVESDVQGELNFANTVPWPVTLRSPGIMGWYAWMPFMECYHGVVSMDHTIDGELNVNGHIIDFTGGRGYIEKDWGRSFPSAWIWLQSNHFGIPGSSFTASVAIIPWIGRSFPGFIIGFWHQGRLYRFATYTGAKIRKLDVNKNHIDWVIADRKHTLEIVVERPETPAALLHAPTINGMDRRIEERLDASIHLRLHAGKNMIYEKAGRHAGLEVVGDIERLVAMWEAETKRQ